MTSNYNYKCVIATQKQYQCVDEYIHMFIPDVSNAVSQEHNEEWYQGIHFHPS